MEQSSNHPEIQYSTDAEGNKWIKVAPTCKLKLVAMEETMFELLISSRNNETMTYHRARYNKLQNEGRPFNPQDIKDPFFIDGKKFYVHNSDVKENEANDQLFVTEALYNSRVYTLTRRKRAKDVKEVAKVNAVQPIYIAPKNTGLSFCLPGATIPVQATLPVPTALPMVTNYSGFVLPSIKPPTPPLINNGQVALIEPSTLVFNPAATSEMEVTADSDEDY